jgi:hypothetical protein
LRSAPRSPPVAELGSLVRFTVMKIINHLFVALLVCFQCGCASLAAVANARGSGEEGPQRHPPQPAFYLLLPVTVPLDVGTLPIQGLLYWYATSGGFH